MRFNKKIYPLLDRFEFDLAEGMRGDFEYNAFHSAVSSVIRTTPHDCKSGISYVSKTFYDEAVKNAIKVRHSLTKYEQTEVHGKDFCLLMSGGFMALGVVGSYYCFFLKDVLVSLFRINNNGFYVANTTHLLSKDTIATLPALVEVLLLFRDLASIKTKVLPPKKKIKDFHCRYKSDFDFPIELLTENWYTESIQGHPFVVRGHWRMQRYGEGLSKKKLIPIAPFMKQGVKRGAFKQQTNATPTTKAKA